VVTSCPCKYPYMDSRLASLLFHNSRIYAALVWRTALPTYHQLLLLEQPCKHPAVSLFNTNRPLFATPKYASCQPLRDHEGERCAWGKVRTGAAANLLQLVAQTASELLQSEVLCCQLYGHLLPPILCALWFCCDATYLDEGSNQNAPYHASVTAPRLQRPGPRPCPAARASTGSHSPCDSPTTDNAM
jgi:hypothetical protein